MQDYFILFSQGSNVKKAIKTYNFILIIKKINVNSVLSFGRRKEVPFANERSYTVNIGLKVFFYYFGLYSIEAFFRATLQINAVFNWLL